jgi:hypothetical protein
LGLISGQVIVGCSPKSDESRNSDHSASAVYINGVKQVEEHVVPPTVTAASNALRQTVVAALARSKSGIDLDAKGWVLSPKLEWPEDGPLLWNGKVGIRFPVEPPVMRPEAPALQRGEMEWHSAAFTDTNDGFACELVAGPNPGWTGTHNKFFALDLRSATLVGVDENTVSEYRLDHDEAVHGRVLELDGSVPEKNIEAKIRPGSKAGATSDWPELKGKEGFPTSGISATKPLIDWSTDIEIEGPEEDQLAIRSFLFYLRTAIPSKPPFQLAPMARSSQIYKGHVFWDADMWLVPALAFIDPQPLMDGFAEYRSLRLQEKGLPFAWESAASGKETAPSSMQREIHVAGDVLWNLNFMKALGAQTPELPRVTQAVARYYESQLSPRPDMKGVYELKNVVSPDEGHSGDNDLYTNLLAMWALKTAGSPKTLFLPKDGQSFLTYEGDRLRSYKQAAAVLAIYPLQYGPAESQAKAMLARFQDKVIPNGPAMSESIHAVIWARLGEADTAYTHWQNSWKPFVKGPLLLFSEKRNSTRTYFTTGAAGALQGVIYGFLGFRVDDRPFLGAAWTKKLLNGKWLSITPHLPSAWTSATFKNFAVLGKRYTLTVRRENGVQRVSVK